MNLDEHEANLSLRSSHNLWCFLKTGLLNCLSLSLQCPAGLYLEGAQTETAEINKILN